MKFCRPTAQLRGYFNPKFLLMFLVACAIYPIGAAGFIYIAHNLSFLKALNVPARKSAGRQ